MTKQEEIKTLRGFKCPHCSWSEFSGEESVGMTPCRTCNSTGYIYEEIKDYGLPPDASQRSM